MVSSSTAKCMITPSLCLAHDLLPDGDTLCPGQTKTPGLPEARGAERARDRSAENTASLRAWQCVGGLDDESMNHVVRLLSASPGCLGHPLKLAVRRPPASLYHPRQVMSIVGGHNEIRSSQLLSLPQERRWGRVLLQTATAAPTGNVRPTASATASIRGIRSLNWSKVRD